MTNTYFDLMAVYLKSEKEQCELIWKPIYEEYRKKNYRLNKNKQIKLQIKEEEISK